ncbi:conserved hypothetical protein [Microsporum canis CBS 113480]|uniref:Rhodopsin domain-containing protein n=1 Tax=Arthroderma otae (strain ATCC MYA-4605 / CBS 113480) TaxID=554155 RepID=C5FDD5_ARTOC|nr:conserved hypothetical protein [Microsporum canis CBS 113480]EEQ27909.1 conserved hypothetical protein [Microsporum canis CBS 113480]
MRNPPPEVIRSWPKPNYINPEYAGPELAIIGVTFATLSVIIVSLRMFVRLHMRKAASWDDWLMVAAMPCLVGIAAASIISTKYGWGFHIWDFKLKYFKQSRITSYICQFLFVPLMSFVKLSILASYLRFFTEKLYIKLAWVQIGLVLAWFVCFTVMMLVACVACVAGCVKSYYMYQTLVGTYDVTWEGYKVWVWTDIEVNLAVICASIPVLRPFAQKYLPKLGFKTASARSQYGQRWDSNRSGGLHSAGIYKQQTIHQTVRSRHTTDDEDDDGGSTIALSPTEYPIPKTHPSSPRPYDARRYAQGSRNGFYNEPNNDSNKDARYANYA